MVKKVLLGILMGILIICMCACGDRTALYLDDSESVSNETEGNHQMSEKPTNTEQSDTEGTKLIYVYVCGSVNSPGVYAIPEGSRVCDLFSVAGGFTKDAATDYWNQARVLTDGEMLYVPTKEEAKKRTEEEKAAAGSITGQLDTNNRNKKVNINTASKEELMTLPGIGESKALAIISYRQENGGFSNIEQLKEISGIKDGVFLKIEEYIVAD